MNRVMRCLPFSAQGSDNGTGDATKHAALEAHAANGTETTTKHAALEARAVAAGKVWLHEYEADVQKIQQLKQHHVRILNQETGEREPLTHCRRADNPKLCKADFPRTL